MRRFIVWLLLLILALTIGACQSLPQMTDLWPAPSGFPVGGRATIALPDRLDVVQPWDITNRSVEVFVSLTHAGLMRLDTTGMPQPELLTDWQASSDGRVITATLTADLQWSDGAPLTASDVVFTYDALKSLPVSSPLTAELALVAAVTRVDDTHVRFTLSRPYAPILTIWSVPILPSHVLATQQVADVNMKNLLVSAGPFTYASHAEDGTVLLARNPHYVLGAPLLDEIMLYVGRTPQQMQADVRTGTVDIAELQTSSSLAETTALSTTTYAQHQMFLAIYNMRAGHVTSDAILRRALGAHLETAAHALFLPESWVSRAVTTSTTLAGAPQLLDEAGWRISPDTAIRQRGDKPLEVSLVVASDNAVLMTHADQLEQVWQALGITVVRQNLARADYLNALIPPYPYDVMLVELAGGRSSSTYADTLFYEPDVRALFDGAQRNDGIPNTRGSLNLSGIQDTTVNAVLARIYDTYESTSRQHLYADLLAALQQQHPLHVLSRPTTTIIYGARLQATTGSLQLSSPWYPTNASRWYVQPPPQ
ncbi:MAG: hypothetical protein RL076_2086 [Chloroflexota bacterium]